MHVSLVSVRAASILLKVPLRAERRRASNIFGDQFLKGILALADVETLPLEAVDDLIAQPIQNLAAIRWAGR